MKNLTTKLSKAGRRVISFTIAAAMIMSMFSAAPVADAAGWKKPVINVKKKTLYYNKAGKKSYTLKIKKNGVRKIKKTTWKTSKKSVVAISKKKKMSVKLKAKKAGKATITATIKYVPKGLWMARTVKLKCKVVSKKAQKKTPKPTTNPALVAKKVVLDSANEYLSTKSEKNTVSLTAAVLNANGNEMDKDEDEIKWTSSSKKVATVDSEGTVTAVSDGTAKITAAFGSIKSAPCTITVDSKAPGVDGAVVTDSKTITVYFSEALEGEPEVSVVDGNDEPLADITAALAKNGKSMTVKSKSDLPAGKYGVTINGLTDLAGNELPEDATVDAIKDESAPTKFFCETSQIPVGVTPAKVYYTVTDQYGQDYAMKAEDATDKNKLTISARTKSGMPLSATPEYDENRKQGYISISGVGSLPVDREILIELAYNGGAKSTLTTKFVDSTGYGEAAYISGLEVDSDSGMGNEGTAAAPELRLSAETKENSFSIKANFRDKFLYSVDKAAVIYRIDNLEVLKFSERDGNESSDGKVKITALKKGTATITAYLASDDEKQAKIKITVLPTKLKNISVKADANDTITGTNGRESEEVEIELTPLGTSLTKDDFEIMYVEGEDRVDTKASGIIEENGKLYVKLKAKADGKNDDIKFYIRWTGKTAEGKEVTSKTITYKSTPSTTVASIEIDAFATNAVTVGKESQTTYRLLNRYGEDITGIAAEQPTPHSDAPSYATPVSTGLSEKDGKRTGILTVKGVSQGDAKIILSLGTITASVSVTVDDTAYVSKVVLGQEPRELIIGEKQMVYIPIEAEDQYGHKYPLLKENIDDELKAEIKCETTPLSLADISISYLKGTGVDNYSVANNDKDEISAIGIKWGNAPSESITAGTKITVTFKNKKAEELTDTAATIIVRPRRAPSELVIDEKDKNKLAVVGAEITNSISVLDQYKDKINLSKEQSIDICVKKDGKTVWEADKAIDSDVTIVSKITPVGDSLYEHTLSIDKEGTYTVYAYIKEGNETCDAATVKAYYNLEVKAAKDIVSRLVISDIVKVTDSNGITTDVDVSKGQFIQAPDTENDEITLKFDYKAYDKDGNEISMPNTLTDLVWRADDTTKTKVTVTSNELKIKMNSDTDEDKLEVKLSYFVDSNKIISASPLTLQIVRGLSILQKDKCKIVAADGETDLCGKNYEISINSKGVDFDVKALDQYGKWNNYGAWSALKSDDEDIATVKSTGTDGRFTVKPGEKAGETTITVYVTEDIKDSFTIKVLADNTPLQMFEETDVISGFASRAELFAKSYYNKPAGTTLPEVDNVCYFAIPVKKPYELTSSSIDSVRLKDTNATELSADNVKVSVGNNNFVKDIPDYKIENNQLLISYVFVALNNADNDGKMKFEVNLADGTKAEAVLKVAELEEDLKCTSIKASSGANRTVDVTGGTDVSGNITSSDGGISIASDTGIKSCNIDLRLTSKGSSWNHMILLTFNNGAIKPRYYFTKKVVDNNTSYGFTAPDTQEGELGYYTYRYTNGDTSRTTQYTVATVDRHSLATIELVQADKVSGSAD